MTVKELCDLYGCSRTAMHHKIKRNEERLKGHITYEKGNTGKATITLDDYAVDFLVPEKYKSQGKYTEEIAELKTSLRNEKMFRNSADIRNEELKNRIYELEAKLEKLETTESENAVLQKKISELNEIISELEKEMHQKENEI